MSSFIAPVGFNLENNDSLIVEAFNSPFLEEARALEEAPRLCIPFLIDLMIYIPKSGIKIYFTLLRGCTIEDKPYWKIIFKYEKAFKVDDQGNIDPDGTTSKFFTLVQVTISAGNQAEIDACLKMSQEGPSEETDRLVKTDITTELARIATKVENREPVTNDDAARATKTIRPVLITG